MLFKRFLSYVLMTTTFITGIGATNVMASDKVKIFIVGDSTACIYGSDDNYAVPRAGWGMYLDEFVKNANVIDLAISGRSSKSLTVEEEYQTLLNEIGKDDYLIIQFGHNDAKKSKEEDLKLRYTDPEGDINTEGSFKHSLYNNYIKVAEEKGANPILITPIARRSFDENGEVKETHGLYDDAMRELAKEVNVPLVDATKMTMDLYQENGLEKTAAFHSIYKDVKKGDKGHDNTHLNHYGAEVVARLISTELKKIDGIKEYIDLGEEGNSNISRYEFVLDVVRTIGGEYASSETENIYSFSDVSGDYSKAISSAKEMGLVLGDNNGMFNGNDNITFEEMYTIIARALKFKGVELDSNTEKFFAEYNKDEFKNYSTEYMAQLVNLWGDIIPKNLNPKENVKFSEAYMMYSLIYDEVNEADENQAPQSIDEIEKVE